MHENPIRRLRRYGVVILGAAGLLLLAGALLSWSWNASISELFGLPQMAFRQAVAAGLFIGIVFAIAGSAFHMRGHGAARLGRRTAS